MRSYGWIRQMPLFATCTIANAILALRAPPGTLTFSSWACAVPLRFDTLASSRLARRIPGVCCRALRVSLRVQCWRFCVPAGLPRAALVCAVSGRRSGASVQLLVWLRNFGRDLPRLPCAGVFGWCLGPNCPCGPFRWT